MTDLRVGLENSIPTGHLTPLEARGPAWLSFTIGPVISSAATAGIPASLLYFTGQTLSLLTIGVLGGFLLFSLAVGLLICAPARRTGANLFANVFSVGHTLLLGLLGAAYFVPGGTALAANLVGKVPFLSALPVLPGSIGAVAPLYLLAFVSFSVMAPMTILIFRYIALSRASPFGR